MDLPCKETGNKHVVVFWDIFYQVAHGLCCPRQKDRQNHEAVE